MEPVILNDKDTIETILRRNVPLNVYAIGDLDDFFWRFTSWYADRSLSEVVLVYRGQELPVVMALSDDVHAMEALLKDVMHLLPRRFHAHLSPGLERVLLERFSLEPFGEHTRMCLRNSSALLEFECSGTVELGPGDLEEIMALYRTAYPGNWFDPRMLETGRYRGMRISGSLVSIAGVHVYSRNYGVAALGNVATAPEYRRRGYGSGVTAALCLSLAKEVEEIALNVRSDNRAAISCYGRLGFEPVAVFREYSAFLE